jgi:hypothetical protein
VQHEKSTASRSRSSSVAYELQGLWARTALSPLLVLPISQDSGDIPISTPTPTPENHIQIVTPTHPTLTRATAPASVPAYAPSQVGRASRRSSTHQTGLHRRLVLNMPRLLRRHRLHVPPQLVHLPPSQPVASTLLRMPCDAEPPCTPVPSKASLS